jgi:hypothetical protein
MARRILRYEIIGFGLLIVISWLDEIVGISAAIFGTPHLPDYREAMIETLFTVVVCVPVLIRTKWITDRLIYLEGMLRVCAWCGRVDGTAVKTTHGICSDCEAKESRMSRSNAAAHEAKTPRIEIRGV